MANAKNNKRALIEGRAALIMIDIQASTFIEDSLVSSIDNMPGYNERMLKARVAVDKARACNIPVIFIQEVHRPNLVDFGRKLDDDEDIHWLEHNSKTDIAIKKMDFRPEDYPIRKRRYSAFFGTKFEILLRGLQVQKMLMCVGLTYACVHYIFFDGHQSDYFCRII
ncbi:MAG: cysteine hydrolase [Ascidiaceihabitans sp.]